HGAKSAFRIRLIEIERHSVPAGRLEKPLSTCPKYRGGLVPFGDPDRFLLKMREQRSLCRKLFGRLFDHIQCRHRRQIDVAAITIDEARVVEECSTGRYRSPTSADRRLSPVAPSTRVRPRCCMFRSRVVSSGSSAISLPIWTHVARSRYLCFCGA